MATEIKYESGRVFHINNDSHASYILQGADDSCRQRALFSSYYSMGVNGVFKHITEAVQNEDPEKHLSEKTLEECLFKDVEEYGEDALCNAMAEWEYTLFYVYNGLALPNGPLPWGDFEE